jgi:hypothetical protein
MENATKKESPTRVLTPVGFERGFIESGRRAAFLSKFTAALSKSGIRSKPLLILFFGILLFPGFLAAEDRRTIPLTLYLIFDGSEGIKNGKDAAIAWISDHIIDRILQDGDNLTIWVAAASPRVIFSESLNGAAQKETIKELLRSITSEGSSADYAGALRDAVAQGNRQSGEGISYTLLVTGTAGGSLRGNTVTEFLRYSRVQDFAGWRVQIVGLDLRPRIQKAVSDYMAGG